MSVLGYEFAWLKAYLTLPLTLLCMGVAGAFTHYHHYHVDDFRGMKRNMGPSRTDQSILTGNPSLLGNVK